jgi:adenosylcobinamide kinase/adenosylcobinamide-phosphate guanylyltransferase
MWSRRVAVTLVLGGARSGKTRYALAEAERGEGALTYVATAQAFDDEMAQRIAQHQAERSGRWRTLEAPLDLAGALASAGRGPVLVDCLTLWLSNLMHEAQGDEAVQEGRIAALLTALGEAGEVVLVSNEVGWGIVPDNALARRFRDEAGRLHQRVAAVADRVVLVVAGLPLSLKGA